MQPTCSSYTSLQVFACSGESTFPTLDLAPFLHLASIWQAEAVSNSTSFGCRVHTVQLTVPHRSTKLWTRTLFHYRPESSCPCSLLRASPSFATILCRWNEGATAARIQAQGFHEANPVALLNTFLYTLFQAEVLDALRQKLKMPSEQ